jgi:hypothetical protein
MPDLRDRFRSLDRLPAPNLWAEVTNRAEAADRAQATSNRVFAFGAAAAVVALAVVIGLQLRFGPPVVGPGPTETASPSTSVGPTPSAEPSASVQASAEPSSGVEPPFSCSVPLSLEASGADFPPLVLQDLRVGTREGYSRIVFEYDGGTPAVEIDLAEPPFLADPSGMELSVSGDPVYRITLHGATKFDIESGTMPYSGPTNFEPGSQEIMQLVESGDFEATHSWYLGVGGGTCLRVFHLTDAYRVVIDIQDLNVSRH